MSVLVVDASVAIKWLIPEVHTEAALVYLEHAPLVAPDLLWAEAGNIAWKKVRRGELSPDEARAVLHALRALPIATHATEPLLEAALELALGLGQTVYDCLYLALALLLGGRMVTADRAFYRAVKASPYADAMLWVEDSTE